MRRLHFKIWNFLFAEHLNMVCIINVELWERTKSCTGRVYRSDVCCVYWVNAIQFSTTTIILNGGQLMFMAFDWLKLICLLLFSWVIERLFRKSYQRLAIAADSDIHLIDHNLRTTVFTCSVSRPSSLRLNMPSIACTLIHRQLVLIWWMVCGAWPNNFFRE